MLRPRYPKDFKTKRELLWYIRGLKDAKINFQRNMEIEENRYLQGMNFMEFDEKGNNISSNLNTRYPQSKNKDN